MITREDISNFLKEQSIKKVSLEELVSNFSSYAITKGVSVDKLGKMISDLRSYTEWVW